MRFVQIAAGEGNLFALGDDGRIYRQTWLDKPTGKTTYNEYGGTEPLMKREYSWQVLPLPESPKGEHV